MSRIYAPGGQKNKQLSWRSDNYYRGPHRTMDLLLCECEGQTVRIIKWLGDDIRLWINGTVYHGIPETLLDISTVGINGIVDGITLSQTNMDYLLWGFADEANSGFTGFGITHKPKWNIRGVSRLPVNKGDTNIIYEVDNAFTYTVGANVCVRVEDGTPPDYEWNWGVVTEIVSDTEIKVDMQNQIWGTTINGITNGQIWQWDKFRPWVIGGSEQQLYSSNYRLIGELLGYWFAEEEVRLARRYRWDEPHREIRFPLIYNSVAVVTNLAYYLGRHIPIWADDIEVVCMIDGTPGQQLILGNSITPITAEGTIQSVSTNVTFGSGYFTLDEGAKVDITNTVTGDLTIHMPTFSIPAGMRE